MTIVKQVDNEFWRDGGRRVIALNGPLPGLALPVSIDCGMCHPCTLYPGLEIERNKETTCFHPSKTSANHWGRQEKRKINR